MSAKVAGVLPAAADDASLSASKSGNASGLARLASELPLASGALGVLLAFAV